jgi:hypothetical protein
VLKKEKKKVLTLKEVEEEAQLAKDKVRWICRIIKVIHKINF